MHNDEVDQGLQRLLQEEQERTEVEMRQGMAQARLAAGDKNVTMEELWGSPYKRISAIKDVCAATGLRLPESKAFVDAYKWDRQRTIEAAVQYVNGQLPEYLVLKPAMSTREWLRLRADIEAEPDIEKYRCKLAQLYLHLTTRSTRFKNIVAREEHREEVRRRAAGDE